MTPNTVPEPVAETTAPATGTPDSSWTRLSIVPDVRTADSADAVRVRRLRQDRERSTHHPHADRESDQSGCVSHVPPGGRGPRGYPAVTVKLMSRVSDLFASLSVTLISSR